MGNVGVFRVRLGSGTGGRTIPRNFWSLRSRRSLAKAGDGLSNKERGAYTVSSLRILGGRRPTLHR